MEEDLLYKEYKACISEINVCSNDRQKRSIFCKGVDIDINEDKDEVEEIYKNSKTGVIGQAVRNCDYNTIFLSNIISENNKENKSSPELLISSMCDNYFQRECNLNVQKISQHTIKHFRNEFSSPTDKKLISIRNKFNSEFRGATEKKLSNRIPRKSICNFPDSCFKSKNSSLKRKFEFCEKNECDIRLDSESKNKPKSSANLRKTDNILSYFKHFKTDDSNPVSKNSKEEIFFESRFINEINSVEHYYSFKQMKNIEIQSSPIRIRIATNIGEDSIEYVDPTMEVELDSAESDTDDPEEPNGQNNVGNEEDHQQHSDLAEENNSNTENNTAGGEESNLLDDDTHPKCDNEEKEVLNKNEKTTDISKPNPDVSEDVPQSNQTENDGSDLKDESEKENHNVPNVEKNTEESISNIENKQLENIIGEIELTESTKEENVNATEEVLAKEHRSDELNTEDFKQVEQAEITNSSGEIKDALEVEEFSKTKEEQPRDLGKIYQDITSKEQSESFDNVKFESKNETLIQNETYSKNAKYTTKDDKNGEIEQIEAMDEFQKTKEEQNGAVFKEHVFTDDESIDTFNRAGENMNLKEMSEGTECLETSMEEEVIDIEKSEDDIVQQKETLEELELVVLDKLSLETEPSKTFGKEERSEEIQENVTEKEDFNSNETAVEGKVISSLTDVDENQELGEIDTEENSNVREQTICGGENRSERQSNLQCEKENNEKKISENLDNDIDIQKLNVNIECAEKNTGNQNDYDNDEDESIKNIDNEDNERTDVNDLGNEPDKDNGKTHAENNGQLHTDVANKEYNDDEKKIVEDCKKRITAFEGKGEGSEEISSKREKHDVEEEDFEIETAVDSENSGSIVEEISETKETSRSEEDIVDKASNINTMVDKKDETEISERKSNVKTGDSGKVSESESQDIKEILDNKEEIFIEPDSCENSSHHITDNEEDSLEKDSLENGGKEEITEEKRKDSECSEKAAENVDFAKEADIITGEKSVLESTKMKTEIIDIKCEDDSVFINDAENIENIERANGNDNKLYSHAEETLNEVEEADKQSTGDKTEYVTDDSKGPSESNEKSINDVLVISKTDKVSVEEHIKNDRYEKEDMTNSEINEKISFSKDLMRSFDKPKSDKSDQSTTDSAKLISPRKGIKVEEDEIETAISSVLFYDEMSDGSEQIVRTVSTIERNKAFEDDKIDFISRQPESSELEDKDSASNLASANFKKEHNHFQETVEEEKVVLDGATAQENVSPKKRKKKRKARSRSVQKGGASSASKKTQDSKGSASKEGTRTSRSVSSTSARSPSVGEKKIPPIKAPVGTTPPPKVKQARSKIGSLENVTHKPKGGDKKVETVKLEWNAKSKVGSLDYVNHKPSGGDKKIITQKIDFKNVQSKVGSKDNLKHKPGGGNLKISTEKLNFKEKAAPKVGSLDNTKHKPGGGNVVIKSEKLHFKEKAAPKIQSRSGSERGSSHGGSETQSPVMPSSPAPQEELPPLNEDDSPSQEEPKPEKAECNGGGESAPEVPSNDASPTKSPEKAENATEDQLIAF